MVKVLHFLGTLNMGGAETMIMNIYRTIDRQQVTFDFVVQGKETGYYEGEATTFGAKIYHVPKRSKSIFGYLKAIYSVIKTNKYSIVHFHTQNAFFTVLDMVCARLAGTNKIIVHSHNTNDWRGKYARTLHMLFRPFIFCMADKRLACGNAAANWLYGTEKNVEIIPLPVRTQKFVYTSEKQNELKVYENLLKNQVFVHVGRFWSQKNHIFLIEIFEAIHKIDKTAVLILIGEGELKSSIEKLVNEKGLLNSVIFYGNIPNVWDKLIMADAFILPSLYEGFPTVVLEAQAAGLPCYISDSVTSLICETDLVKMISLEESPETWAKIIVCSKKKKQREKYNEMIKQKYDVEIVTDKLTQIYFNLNQD